MELNDLMKLSPVDFEKLVLQILKCLGYNPKHITLAEDIGVDIIAINEKESLAVQVKKYDKRKINLDMIYHTYGAAAYYECSRPIIVTLSNLTDRAKKVADKLKVEIWGRDIIREYIKLLPEQIALKPSEKNVTSTDWFYNIWNTYIKGLKGMNVRHISHKTYITVIDVNNDGMTIKNSKGTIRYFDISAFREVITLFKNTGIITRQQINEHYQRRGASAICAVIASIPGVEKDNDKKNSTLLWRF